MNSTAAPAGTTRVQLPPVEQMSVQQRKIYDATVAAFGGPVGPRIALLNTPEIAQKWTELAGALEATKLDPRLWELTILIVAREWDSQFEWWAHSDKAAQAGIAPDVIEALRVGRKPRFQHADEAALYEYFTELYRRHDVSDAAYERLNAAVGNNAVVELTVLAGHYNSVAMTLAAHRMPLPSTAKAALPPKP